MEDCAEGFTFDPQVTDDGGAPASLSVETLTPGAPTELVVDDRFRVTVPAVESRGGMDVLATATDTFGVETTARLRVIFGGDNCSDLGTFYGVDPDSCREVSVGIAGDDRGGAVLSESYVFYNGDDALVRMDLELNDVTAVGPEDTDTLFSDSETFGLYSLWSSEFAFTNVGDHDQELTDLGVFDAFVPVDEETLEVGPAISLEVPVFCGCHVDARPWRGLDRFLQLQPLGRETWRRGRLRDGRLRRGFPDGRALSVLHACRRGGRFACLPHLLWAE